MLRKQIIPIALISCLLTSYAPLSANAAMDYGVTSIDVPATGEITVTSGVTTEPTQKELEQIITTVKSKISVPKELTKFEYNYNAASYYSLATWYLNWSNEDNTKQISVQSDQDGHISYYYSNNSDKSNYTPKYLKDELKATADKFIKEIAPDIYGNIEYVDAQFQGTYSGQYIYKYQRVENGIAMPDNTITVGVNYETANAVSYNASWVYKIEIPSAKVSVTEKEAAEKIGKKIKMELSYQNAYTTDADGNATVKAYLVYSPDKTYIAVDAKTGEVYTTQNEWIDNTKGTATEESATSTANDGRGLTEEEIIKVEELANLISKDDAIKAVTGNKNLLIDDNLVSITAKLYKQNDNYYITKDSNDNKESKYVWNISLSDPREVDSNSSDTYRAYANASVDAVTGKLISFNASVKDYYNMSTDEWQSVKVKYSIKQSQNLFEDFLKTQIPDYFKNSVLTNNDNSYVIAYKDEKEVYGGYNYQYERVNEGINYSYNGIYGAVDGVTGKIYSYSYNWNDNITFESPKGVISATKAFEYYIDLEGYNLVYEINSIHNLNSTESMSVVYYDNSSYTVENEIRLVYRTDINPTYISPFTGKQLNYDGEEYTKDGNSYSYSDIKGLDSARSIKLLADIGIGFSGGKFLPEQAITTKELGEFLSLIGIYYNTDKYKLANDNSNITRLNAAKFVLQIMGYEKVAKIKGIYAVDFKDKDQISEANMGYVALAQGLDLITCDSNKEFKPTSKLTRAEVADMLIAMLTAQE